MRLIKLPDCKTHPALTVVRMVAETPQRGANMDEVRRRIRILDAVEAVGADVTSLRLEDADHAHLVQIFSQFQFAIAHRDLVAVEDAIKAAAKE